MKATKKPVTIDYLPYEGDYLPVSQWVYDMGDRFDEWFAIPHSGPYHGLLYVKTIEGTYHEVTADDVIIRGVNGEYYPCKKDIFYKTYDI